MRESKAINKNTRAGAYVKAYAPFFLVAVIGLIYHILMQPMGGDDVFFSEALEEVTMWEYLSHRYLNWTSRVVSEFILVTVIQVPIVWRMINFLMFVTFPLLFAKLFGDSGLMRWCGAGAVLIFPFHDMGTAGWITTTVTHFWPLWGIFFVGLLVKKMVAVERIHPMEAVLGVLVCIMTGSHEQYAVIMMVVFVICSIYLYQQKRKPASTWLFVVFVIITIASLAVILLCPGNAGRNAVSIADLPIYAEFGFGEKLYLGLLSIERVFIANADAVFVAVILLWSWLVYLKTNSFIKTMISSLPLMILFGQTVVRTAYPGLSGLFVMPGQILEWSWTELSTWIPMVYLVISVIGMIYAVFQLFDEDLFTFFSLLILLGCGFGAGMVLGFMATIYVSGERVYAPLYAILMFTTLLAIDQQRSVVTAKLKETSGKLVITPVVLLCLVNVFFITLSL